MIKKDYEFPSFRVSKIELSMMNGFKESIKMVKESSNLDECILGDCPRHGCFDTELYKIVHYNFMWGHLKDIEKLRDLLEFAIERLVNVHGESSDVDYIINARELISLTKHAIK